MSGLGTIVGDLARGLANTGPVKRMLPVLGDTISRDEYAANDLLGAKDAYFRIGGKSGEILRQFHMNYQSARAGFEKQLDIPVNKLQQEIFKSPELRTKVNMDSPLSEIYQHAASIKHPIAAPGGAISQIAKARIGNAAFSLNQLRVNNIAQARVLASNDVYGSNYENIMPHIIDAFNSKDPTQIKWAEGAMNLISNETHDTSSFLRQGNITTESRFKHSVGTAFDRENAYRKLKGNFNLLSKVDQEKFKSEKLLPPIKTKATYEPPGDYERRIQNLLRTVQLPFVALKHISQYGNLSSMPAPRLAHALLSMSDSDFKAHLDMSSILAYTEHDVMDRAIRGGDSAVARWTGSPTMGQLLFKSYHMPFFSYLKTRQLTYAGSVGYWSIQDWFRQALEGKKIAIANLKEIGIDPADAIKQGGVPTSEQISKGMFHFVNNRFFMDKSIEQALMSNKNPWMRSATMYHTFVNAQQRFLRRELYKMYKAGDYVGLAQFAGTIGILWPAVAPMVKSLEVLGRTANPNLAMQSAQKDYSSLTSGNIKDMSGTYIDLLAHYAAFGVYTSYVQAAHGDRLAYAMLGPNIGMFGRAGQDALNFIFRSTQAGKHNAAPLVRDALEDTLPIAGNVLAHKIAPTAKEEPTGRPHRPSRRKGTANPWEF